MTPTEIKYLYDPQSKLCYVTSPGNASTTHESFFIQAGWKLYLQENIIPPDAIYFTHIQEPKERLIKGISNILHDHKLANMVDDTSFKKLLPLLYHDHKIMSITSLFSSILLTKIHFIIMDHTVFDCDTLTNRFLTDHNVKNLTLTPKNMLNVSRKNKQLTQDKVRKLIVKRFYSVYNKDNVIYKDAFDRIEMFVKPTFWERLKRWCK